MTSNPGWKRWWNSWKVHYRGEHTQGQVLGALLTTSLKNKSINLFLAALGVSRGPWGAVAAAHRLSCLSACGISVLWLGMEPASPALQGGFLTTGLPGKSLMTFLFNKAVTAMEKKVKSCRSLGSFNVQRFSQLERWGGGGVEWKERALLVQNMKLQGVLKGIS